MLSLGALAVWVLVAALVGTAIGFALARLAAAARFADATRRADVDAATLRAHLDGAQGQARTAEDERDAARADAERLRRDLSALGAAHAAVETDLARTREAFDDKLKLLARTEATLRETFKALAADALKDTTTTFLALAEARLDEKQVKGAADLARREQAIVELVKPVSDAVSRVEQEVRHAETRRVADAATLTEQMATLASTGQELRVETAKLADALKRPGTRGRWGELQLRRVVELAGMAARVDFDEQATLTQEQRRLRPDLIVRLPGDRVVVVDAKAPLDAYLRALDARDEEGRRVQLREHARQVRAHVVHLASRGYAASIQPAPDFVVMFLPGETFFSAALEQDPELIEYGVAQRVILASPTTLIALLRAVATGWQQDAVARHAKDISDLGRQLHAALRNLAVHMQDVGARLRASVEAYNRAVGSLETTVLAKARKFKTLGAAEGDDLPSPPLLETRSRAITSAELTDTLPLGEELPVTTADEDR